MLSFTPLNPALPMPPTCNAQLVAAKANCAIYTMGGVEMSMHTPTVQQWSFTVERGITQNLALQVSYVGSEDMEIHKSIDEFYEGVYALSAFSMSSM